METRRRSRALYLAPTQEYLLIRCVDEGGESSREELAHRDVCRSRWSLFCSSLGSSEPCVFGAVINKAAVMAGAAALARSKYLYHVKTDRNGSK